MINPKYIAYVDGTFNRYIDLAGYGLVILLVDDVNHLLDKSRREIGLDPDAKLLDGELIYEGSGVTEDGIQHWQIAGECTAAMKVIDKCKELGIKNISIFHDYTGLAYWVNMKYRAKTEFTIKYRDHMWKSGVKIIWHKVKSHTGIKWNEYVDQLANKAIQNYRGEKL